MTVIRMECTECGKVEIHRPNTRTCDCGGRTEFLADDARREAILRVAMAAPADRQAARKYEVKRLAEHGVSQIGAAEYLCTTPTTLRRDKVAA